MTDRALAILTGGRLDARGRSKDLLQRVALSDGTPVSLPTRYFDARSWIAVFLVERAAAEATLGAAGLRAVATADGRAEVWVGGFSYADADLGAYDEVALGLWAMAPGDPAPALHVADLPVSTSLAERAGRELWGYPKFVGDIAIRGNANAVAISLSDPEGAPILSLTGEFCLTETTPPADLWTFSVRQGRRLRTRLEIVTPFATGPGEGCTLAVGPSRHLMAARLRDLGLDGARPTAMRYGAPFQALLFAGSDAGLA